MKFTKVSQEYDISNIFQITFLDMLLYSIFMENGLESKALRWSRILRPAFIINLEGRQVRNASIRDEEGLLRDK